jgi:hypothetical protein
MVAHKRSGKKDASQRRIERRDGERALSGGLERERKVFVKDSETGDFKKDHNGNWVMGYDNPRHKWKGSTVADESMVNRSYHRHVNVANGMYGLDIAGFVEDNPLMPKHDAEWFEERRFALMGAARELLRAGEEVGNPEYSVLGAKVYEKLGVNADNAVRRSLRRSLDRVHSHERDMGRNPKYFSDFTSKEPERLTERVYDGGAGKPLDQTKVSEAEEMLARYEGKSMKVIAGTLAIVSFSGALGFFSSNITGNAVIANSLPINIMNWVGAGLFLVGLLSFFSYNNLKRKYS